MDGFALALEPTRPGGLPVVHRIAAGTPGAARARGRRGDGRSRPAAVVPEGADAVIPIEYVVEHDNEIEIEQPVEAGANVRPAAGDIARRRAVVESGHASRRRGSSRALAAAGIAEVRVRPEAARRRRRDGQRAAPRRARRWRRDRSTRRTESCSRRSWPRPGPRSSGRARSRTTRQPIARPRARARCRRPRHLGRRLGRTARPRAGDPRPELGVEEVFWGVSVKPGKPISFGVAETALVFGLPGNPVSVLVGLRALRPAGPAGSPGQRRSRPTVRAAESSAAQLTRNPVRDELVRARVRTTVRRPGRSNRSRAASRT
mgnify:CR=1 FL=1